jgi:predicted acylesterase/phospholipase RssA
LYLFHANLFDAKNGWQEHPLMIFLNTPHLQKVTLTKSGGAMGISKRRFRILSLDGGGTFSMLQAKVLADLYPNQCGHEVLSHFDMVVACSGGSVVASALIDGMSPMEIFRLFDEEKNRLSLYGALPWYRTLLYHVTRFMGNPVGPRFSTRGKLNFLHEILRNFGKVPLHELPAKLDLKRQQLRQQRGEPPTSLAIVFITYDFDRDRARMMRSNWESNAANFPKHKCSSIHLADAAHASSTAPVNWFDQPAHFDHGRFWDGAMTGYNNPVLAGVTEAIAMGNQACDIGVLSIGTSSIALPLEQNNIDCRLCQPRPKTRFLPSLAKVAKMIINDPPDAHTYIAHLMTGGRVPIRVDECPITDTAVVRMNPMVQPVPNAAGKLEPPQGWTVEEFVRLTKLDIATLYECDVALIKRLADGWMAGHFNNQPIRHGGDYPAKNPAYADRYWEIGHRSYAQAKAAWQQGVAIPASLPGQAGCTHA